MQYIASGRASLATEVAGDGETVVFLHANVCDRRMWRAQFDRMSATHKVVAYDRRGFGETRAEPEDFSALADLVAVLEATAGGQPAILVGCSLGGRIALDAAVRHPSRVRALVLIAPNVAGAPDPVYAPDIEALMKQSKQAEASGDLERLNAMKARLWLDGPLALEGRVTGPARDLLLDMNGIALAPHRSDQTSIFNPSTTGFMRSRCLPLSSGVNSTSPMFRIAVATSSRQSRARRAMKCLT
ncbi:alpha/beta fold hydrolase [Bradyrhizobium frederickii]|uniref:alpha/beta fold hydrolase n=1 Tax=Bradyrhizobium frederickii TaxID=2560054 RepID=UPI001F3D5D5B|nr:alpha/beta hydrolase [Bradyrhizobium frederickii]